MLANFSAWHLGSDSSSLASDGCCVYIVGCLAAHLASTHWVPVTLPSSPTVGMTKNVSRHWQMSWAGWSAPPPRLRTTGIQVCMCLVAQSCPTICDPTALQAPLSMGILQARILKWIAVPSPRGSSQPEDQTQVSHIAGRFFLPSEPPTHTGRKED